MVSADQIRCPFKDNLENFTTVMILNFRTDVSGQTVQTLIRLLEEQSDEGLHCLLFDLHILTKYLQVWPL